MTAPTKAEPLTAAEAQARVLAGARPLDVERVALDDSLGRVLAQDVVAPVSLPPWNNAGMDGYAVRADDVREAARDHPTMLTVIETIAAGAQPTRVVGRGEAARIMTGAPIPAGADSVVRVEDTDGGADTVMVLDARDAGHNVRPRGEDVRSGEAVLRAGTAIGPAQLGLLASVGAASVAVRRRPRVAVLSTGDELADVTDFDAVRGGRRIVNSNGPAICALVRDAGGIPTALGIVRDDPEEMRAAVERAAGHDLLITTGGVSVGAFDYTRDVLRALGAELSVWRVRIRPGAPTGFGRLGAMPWLGLPGNPVSSLVTFELFARPLMRALAGHTRLFRRTIPVRLDESLTLAAPLTHFLRVTLHPASDDGLPRVRLTGGQGSGLLSSMARADALLVVPPDRSEYEAGERLEAIPLGDGGSFGESSTLGSP